MLNSVINTSLTEFNCASGIKSGKQCRIASNRALQAIAVVIISCLLTSCLESEKPLIDSANASQWFDSNELLTMELSSTFVPKSKKGTLRPELNLFKFDNNVWQSFAGASSFDRSGQQYKFGEKASSRMLIQPLSSNDTQTMLVQRNISTFYYGFARKLQQDIPELPSIFKSTFDYIVVESALRPSAELVDQLQKAGVNIKPTSRQGYSIDSSKALARISKALLPSFLTIDTDLKKYRRIYLVAEKKRTRQTMLTMSNAIECLGRAGHRYDPVMSLVSDYVVGTASWDDIETASAKAVCEAAYADKENLGELANSVSYALSRVAQKTGDVDHSLSLLDQLKNDQSGLAVVARAYAALTRAQDAGESNQQALQILEEGLAKVAQGTRAEFNMLFGKASMITSEPVGEQPENEARKILRYLHKNNYDQGTLYLARLIKAGTGGPANIEEARSLYIDLYEALLPEAYTDLGLAAYNGDMDFRQNHAMAATLFSDSLELASTSYGHYLLGFMQMFGQGVVQDHKEGFINLTKSHEMGRVNATTEVGYALYSGSGVEKDIAEGIKLLQLASSRGDTKAGQYLQQLQEADPNNFSDK